VLGAANKDGGAHVDPRLTPEYEALSRELVLRLGFVSPITGDRLSFKTDVAHLVALRQMAWEILNSPDVAAAADQGERR
jgi:hypothetical protein